MRTNVAKAKKQATHEFFPRSRVDKKDGMIFNKAPINKNEAYKETRSKVISDREEQTNRTMHGQEKASFMSKLYQDDDEYDELKVHGLVDEDDEEVQEARNNAANMVKRKTKAIEKMSKTSKSKTKSVDVKAKIGKLALKKDMIGMFAICEIGKDYLVVNHTRNSKGYISLLNTQFKSDQFRLGQLIVAMVNYEIGGAQTGQVYNFKSGNAGLNRKIQLTLDSKLINKMLSAEKITKNMIIQAEVDTKEAKGYTLNLGFKDKSKGFLKFDEKANEKSLKQGQIVMVVVKNVIPSSKVIRCELMSQQNCGDCVHQLQDESNLNDTEFKITTAHVKPGFLVSGKISKVYDNGIEMTFLGGLTGTVFADHLSEDLSSTDMKIGTKITARVISVDPLAKIITLSMKTHIINWAPEQLKAQKHPLSDLTIGSTYSNVKIQKHVFGSSYLVTLKELGMTGFLHKIHTQEEQPEEVEEDEDGRKPHKEQEVLEIGQVLEKIKIKEINYFDGMPLLSMKESILKQEILNYSMVSVGQFMQAKIEKVNLDKLFVQLSCGQMHGFLHLEHMADHSIKVIPPKFQEQGKSIRVRVLNVDVSKRFIEFTKKDSLMKEDVPVYSSIKEVKKGDAVTGVIVSQTEHGYVVKTFSNIKGLLTFEDIKQKEKNFDQSQYKIGSIIKAFCLFKKRDQGIALTLNQQKAQAEVTELESQKGDQTMSNKFLPSEQELEQLLAESKYSTMLKASKDPSNVGKLHTFRIIEGSGSDKPYYVVKTTDQAKKSKNFIGLLPKCLVSSFLDFQQLSNLEETYQGLILELLGGQLPVISIQPELIALKSEIPNKETLEQSMSPGSSFIGIINGVTGKSRHISVRFMDGVSKGIKVKDLNTVEDYQKIYYPGKVVRVAVNKLERLCTKEKVIYGCLASQSKSTDNDMVIQISAFGQQFANSLKSTSLNIGAELEVEVQLIKDYGLIVQMKNSKSEVKTGFILNNHKLHQKYKQGQVLKCILLDVDPLKKIADLKEISSFKTKGECKDLKVGQNLKVVIELNKESYAIVSQKASRSSLGVCILNNFNQDNISKDNLQIDEEIEVKVANKNEAGFYEFVRVQQQLKKKVINTELKAGSKFIGQIQSIKNQCAFVQVPTDSGKGAIGRLHMIQCQSAQEFKQFTVGDRIEAKILSVSQELKRTWIELTRNEKHMQKLQGLDEEELSKLVNNQEDLKIGQKYQAMVLSCSNTKDEPINLRFSHPMLLQVSPFVSGTVPFNQIVSVQQLQKFGYLANPFKVGQVVNATYIGQGNFSLLEKELKPTLKKGELITARFVKHVVGKGVTVQTGIKDNQFGFIPLCEITDELTANVLQYIADKSVFAARVIGQDSKSGKTQLSARESVVDEKSWNSIKPEGTSIDFKQNDEERQATGNQRNKILKYGSDVALQRGDLAIGYVTNIGKAGCFIQIGYNCTVRAGLNELNDSANYDFSTQMPVGRLVVGRISKIDDLPTGAKRFHFSTRQSLVVYGVGVVDRSKLSVGDNVEAILLAFAEGKAFGQIKGSYIKLKVKNLKGGEKVGDHVVATLNKVTKEKISSSFTKPLSKTEDITDSEKKAITIFESVAEEAATELEALKKLNATGQGKQTQDFEQGFINQKSFLSKEEQMVQQIKDLNELEEQEDEVMKVDSDDSDAEEMKRLIDYEDASEEGEQEQDDDEEMQSGLSQESSDEDMEGQESQIEDDSSEKSNDSEKLLKKRTLKDRMREEQAIRAQENKMRDGKSEPTSIDEFERLIIANQDQSYLWIQYIAFMLDNLGVDAARKVAERAVKNVGISNDQDKLNIWTAYMNLESNFGSQQTLEECTKKALQVNDRKKIYLNLIQIYKSSAKMEYIEPIYKQLTKKFGNDLDLWSNYLEFLIEMRNNKTKKTITEFQEPKEVLQRALQALTKDQHVGMISKYGMLEFKNGQPEIGRTMFEGIVSNYPKRMDIWSVYMDMETKFGDGNQTQAKHLFERCLSNEHIQSKPKKLKLVYQKYMEFENKIKENASKQ